MEAVAELIRRGRKPGEIVVIDPRADALDKAESKDVVVLAGDATRNVTLEAVKVGRASALIVAAGRDDTSTLIVLIARRLAADLPISVVIRSEDNESPATQAGANTVINPASFAGLLLAGSTSGPHLADYLMDLADGSRRPPRRGVALRTGGRSERDRPAAILPILDILADQRSTKFEMRPSQATLSD